MVADEWPRMLKESSSPATEQALFALVRAVRDLPASDDINSAVHTQMLSLTQKVVEARADRIAVVTNHVQQFAWAALFLLGFLTQFAVGMVNLDRLPGNAGGIALFGVGAVVALWLIAMQDNPFRGPSRVEPTPMVKVIATVSETMRR